MEKGNHIDTLQNTVLKYTQSDFSQKIVLSNRGDEIDCLAKLINTLVEKLQVSLASEKQLSAELKQTVISTKQSEESRLLFTSIVSLSDDAIISKDLNGNITSWNKGAERIFGYTAAEATGKHISLIIPPALQSEESNIIKRIIKGQFVDHFETERLRKDGTSVYVSLTISAIKDAAGNIIGASKISRDITSRKKAEAKMTERTTQLLYANKELESFSYSVAHDLRTPLRGVLGYALILKEDHSPSLNDEGKRLLGEIEYNANTMGTLIDDLLTFSKITRKEVNKAAVDMNVTVAEALTSIEKVQKHHAKIIVSKLDTAYGDAALIKQAIGNLLSNAIKYSSKAEFPVIEIKSKIEDGDVIYSITDNGVGFDMEFADKLFGVFQRLHSDEEFEGTGVGLAIAQRIVHRHNGKIWAQSKEGEGATFSFSLPHIKQQLKPVRHDNR